MSLPMRHDLFHFSGNAIPHAAITVSRSSSGTHVGLIYRDDDEGLQRVDFYLDGGVRSLPWRGQHFYIIPNTGDDDDALSNLAALCQVMVERYRDRPPEHLYSLKRNPNAYSDPQTGELHLGGSVGASCASFVLILCHSARIELVASGDNWPYRPHSDDPRHEELIMMLERQGASADHIARVRAELPCPRVAPEEVAGAGMYPNLPEGPADRAFAEKAGKWIMGLFDHNEKHGV